MIDEPDFEENEFIDINEGDYVNITSYTLNEGKTEPPSRFS